MSMTPRESPGYLLEPPYLTFSRLIPASHARPGSVAAGALLAIRVRHDASWDNVAEQATTFFEEYTSVGVVLWTDLLGPDRAAGVISRARSIGIRAVVPRGRPRVRDLREQLTDESDLAAHIVLWLRRRSFNLTARDAELFEELVRRARDARSFNDIPGWPSATASTWRRHFAQGRVNISSIRFGAISKTTKCASTAMRVVPGTLAVTLRRTLTTVTGGTLTARERPSPLDSWLRMRRVACRQRRR
jgi:hypothetical protein